MRRSILRSSVRLVALMETVAESLGELEVLMDRDSVPEEEVDCVEERLRVTVTETEGEGVPVLHSVREVVPEAEGASVSVPLPE